MSLEDGGPLVDYLLLAGNNNDSTILQRPTLALPIQNKAKNDGHATIREIKSNHDHLHTRSIVFSTLYQ